MPAFRETWAPLRGNPIAWDERAQMEIGKMGLPLGFAALEHPLPLCDLKPNEPILDHSDVRWIDSQVVYLRMEQRPRTGWEPDSSLQMHQLPGPVDPQYYLELYQRVGLSHDWVDRLVIPVQELNGLINREGVEVWIFLHDDHPCGYVELVRGPDHVEILYFGLFPEFAGRGFGTAYLRMAVEVAWRSDPEWVELNTCDLDSTHALEVYKRVGFEIYTTRLEKRSSIF